MHRNTTLGSDQYARGEEKGTNYFPADFGNSEAGIIRIFTNISIHCPMNWRNKWSQSWLGNSVRTASLSGRT